MTMNVNRRLTARPTINEALAEALGQGWWMRTLCRDSGRIDEEGHTVYELCLCVARGEGVEVYAVPQDEFPPHGGYIALYYAQSDTPREGGWPAGWQAQPGAAPWPLSRGVRAVEAVRS